MTATPGTNGSSMEVDGIDRDPEDELEPELDGTDADADVEDTSETDEGEHEESLDDQLHAEAEEAITDADEVDAEDWFEALDAVDAEAEESTEGDDTEHDDDTETEEPAEDDVSAADEVDGEPPGVSNDGEQSDDDPQDEVDAEVDPAAVDELDETGETGETGEGNDTVADDDAENSAARADTDLVIEAGGPPDPPLAPVDPPAVPAAEWTTRQLGSVLSRVAAIVVALAVVGFGLGAARGGTNVARAEFVYTLDQSVPDSFLREDRRLLTQVATFTSDAVLLPVAQQFDLDVDDLRGSISIETVALSEVLRLEVSDPDAGRALAINRAVLDHYLQIITAAAPAGDSVELSRQRDAVVAELAEVDRQLLELTTAAERDAVLDVRQDSIQRQIDLTRDRTAALQGLVDDTLFTGVGASRTARLNEELEASRDQLAALEAELTTVVGERAELATATTTEPAVLREVQRLESQLSTIDEELSQRELGPLVASPIRELSEPTVEERSAIRAGLQGAATGALLALPLAAWVAYRTRRHQLWFG